MATLNDQTQRRKNTNLPYMENPNQPLQITNNAANMNASAAGGNTVTATSQGQGVPPAAGQNLNDAVLQKLQGNVLQGSNNPVMDQTEQLTSRILQNPTSLGNPQAYVNRGMDQYNRSMANQQEQLRRQMAPTAGSGLTQQMLADVAFQTAQGRADTRRGLENEVSQQNFADLLKAAAEGRATATTKGNLIQQGIQNLVAARGAAEGAEQRDFARETREDEQSFQMGMQQMQNNWMTSERLDGQTFQTQMARLQADIAEAAAKGDFERARTLQQDQLATQLKMQTQGFQQEEKMAYLDSQLQEARAQSDYGREIGIRRFQHMQDLDTLQKQFGHEEAMQEIDLRKQLALQNNDSANLAALNQAEFEFRAEEAAKDRAIQSLQLQLQERGVDMQETQAQWNRIQDAIEAGQIGPEAGLDYMRQALEGTGITVAAPNAIQEAIASAKMDLLAEKAQFATGQPQYIQTDEAGNQIVDEAGMPQMTAEGEAAFSQYMNRTYYNPQVQTGSEGGQRGPNWGRGATGALSGAATGAALGSFVPVIGTGVGAAVGGLVGGLAGLFGG